MNKLLLSFDKDFEYEAIHFAADTNDHGLIRTLLIGGINVNLATHKCRKTALMICAQKNHVESLEVLFEYNADLNAKDEDGKTALHFAAEAGLPNIITILLKNGAYMHAKNRDGKTALIYALLEKHHYTARFLLDNGMNVNTRDNVGQTSLHYVAEAGMPDMIRLLLEYNIDIFATSTSNAYTALDSAYYQCIILQMIYNEWTYSAETLKYNECIEILLKYSILSLELDVITYEILCEQCWDNNHEYFIKKCLEEIKKLKETRLFILSYFDIIQSNLHTLSKYAKNDFILYCIYSEECDKQFPLYADVLRIRIRSGMQRHDLLKYAYLDFLTPYFPEDVIEIILKYLSNDDLISLQEKRI